VTLLSLLLSQYLYQLVKAKPSLAQKVQKIVAGYVESHRGSGHVEVPVEDVDSLIQADFKETSLSTTVYILNPKIPVDSKGREIPYHYVKKGHHCGTSLWAGQERYTWVDISSTSQQYGPSTMGPGVVTPYSIPRLAHYTKKNAVLVHELASHLVTLVRRTCQQLVTPSLQHFPVPYESKTIIRLVLIRDSLSLSGRKTQGKGGFDFDVVKAQLARLQLVGQSISFKQTDIDFIRCPVCATAFYASRKVHTSTIDGSGVTVPNAYLSSESLHEWLGRVRGSIPLDDDGDEEDGVTRVVSREIPIYLFDLSLPEHAMQIDRNKQAVGFSDTVVAVQSSRGEASSGRTRLDQSCGRTPLEYSSKYATRPILAAVLQGGWGVAATHESWDQASNKTQIEWLWSVGPTVFGYFSDDTTLPFSIRDAAKRSVLYSVVNESIAGVHTFIRDFARYGKELDEVLSTAQHTEFLRRWNVYVYKMDKAGLYISLHNHEHAMYYLLSVKHDIAALRDIVRVAGQGLHSSMVCNKIYTNASGGSSGGWVALLAVVLLCGGGYAGQTGRRGVTLLRERVKRG